MEAYIYWIDKYSGGYRKGVSHASFTGVIAVCGTNLTPSDGGYHSVRDSKPECKKCLKKLNRIKP